MARLVSHTLVLLIVASSTVAAVPCFCEAMTIEHGDIGTEAEGDQGDEDDCCAGDVSDEVPADLECAHCASGLCDGAVTLEDDTPPTLAGPPTPELPSFQVGHVIGPDVSEPMHDGMDPSPAPVRSGDLATSRQNTYARIRVIRC